MASISWISKVVLNFSCFGVTSPFTYFTVSAHTAIPSIKKSLLCPFQMTFVTGINQKLCSKGHQHLEETITEATVDIPSLQIWLYKSYSVHWAVDIYSEKAQAFSFIFNHNITQGKLSAMSKKGKQGPTNDKTDKRQSFELRLQKTTLNRK